jgi:putative selenium metabolism protein SsnA
MAGSDADPAASMALCGATVVVALAPPEVVRADLVLADGRVQALGTPPAGVVCRDCTGSLIVPGNVCSHHHLYSALSRGMPYALAPPRDFTEILQRIWWRLDRALDEESVGASALRGGLDALLAGTTTIVDHHASPNFIDGSLDVIAEALGALGVRAVLCYEVTDRDGRERAVAGLGENRRFLSRPRALARGMVGAHASFTLSEETLEACAGLAADAGVGVHIHVAEDEVDERDSLAKSGCRVAERLSAAGVLSERALLAHCVHVDEAEVRLIEGAGATVACNPRSNMNNAVGYSPFNRRAAHVALGTDGLGGDMFAESQAGFFRAKESDPATPPEWPLVHLASSARLAGLVYDEPLLGTLRPGAPADLCVLAYDAPTPLCADNLAGHWVFGLSSGQVRDVYVAGQLVVEAGRSTRVDEGQAVASSRRVSERLFRRLEETPPHTYDPRRG